MKIIGSGEVEVRRVVQIGQYREWEAMGDEGCTRRALGYGTDECSLYCRHPRSHEVRL